MKWEAQSLRQHCEAGGQLGGPPQSSSLGMIRTLSSARQGQQRWINLDETLSNTQLYHTLPEKYALVDALI